MLWPQLTAASLWLSRSLMHFDSQIFARFLSRSSGRKLQRRNDTTLGEVGERWLMLWKQSRPNPGATGLKEARRKDKLAHSNSAMVVERPPYAYAAAWNVAPFCLVPLRTSL